MLKKVKIIAHDLGWKGTCYRAEEVYYVLARELPPPHAPGYLRPVFPLKIWSINRDDCVRVPWTIGDAATILLRTPRQIRDWYRDASIRRSVKRALRRVA